MSKMVSDILKNFKGYKLGDVVDPERGFHERVISKVLSEKMAPKLKQRSSQGIMICNSCNKYKIENSEDVLIFYLGLKQYHG